MAKRPKRARRALRLKPLTRLWRKRRESKRRSLIRLLVNPATLTVGTIAWVVFLFIVGTPLDRIELNWLDLRFRTRGPLKPTPDVVLAAIDEKSLAIEGRWPWR